MSSDSPIDFPSLGEVPIDANDGQTHPGPRMTEPHGADLPELVARALVENRLYHVDFEASDGYNDETVRTERPASECNVVASLIDRGPYKDRHRLLLDLDIPAALVPSSTPGHSHLYLDTACNDEQLAAVLNALTEAGVLEAGYASASIARGHTALRIPGVKKNGTDQ